MAVLIDYETQIDVPAEPPAVPEKLAAFLRDNLSGTKRVLIQHEYPRGRWKKINSFKLDALPGKAPSMDTEDVGAGAMTAIHAHFGQLRRGDEDPPPQNYRVFLQRILADNREHKPSCEYLYDPAGEEPPYDSGEGIPPDEIDLRWRSLTETLMSERKELFGLIKDRDSTITNLAQQNQTILAPFATMFGFMSNVWVTGAQMQQQAMQWTWDAQRLEARERHSDKKFDMVVDVLKKPLYAALEAKFGIDLSDEEDGDDDDDEEDDEPAPRRRAQPKESTARPTWDGTSASAPTDAGSAASDGGDKKAQAADAQGDDGDDESDEPPVEDEASARRNPVAWMARELGMTLRPGQWQKLQRILEPKEIAALVSLFEARTDKQLVARFDAIWKDHGISLAHLLELQKLLDKRQKKNLGLLTKMVTRARQGWK